MFNGPDIGMTPVIGRVRGKVAIYNENLRDGRAEARRDRRRHVVAARADRPADVGARPPALLARRATRPIARMVLRALNVENDLEPFEAEPLPRQTWRAARRDDIGWAREYFAPWILRRLRTPVVGRRRRAEAPDLLASAARRARPDA